MFLLYERLSNIELGHFDYRLFPFLNPPVEVAIRWPRVLVVKSLFDNQIRYLVWKYSVRALVIKSVTIYCRIEVSLKSIKHKSEQAPLSPFINIYKKPKV